ncbi:hypothetical protein ACH4FA_12665 [Streptomyces sp. NPDC017966]|uniref:hypothetical protein n=1 Tax=Streptomyces sp. NPDC017966 TaxID=3365023 RepID=UPI00379B491F
MSRMVKIFALGGETAHDSGRSLYQDDRAFARHFSVIPSLTPRNGRRFGRGGDVATRMREQAEPTGSGAQVKQW